MTVPGAKGWVEGERAEEAFACDVAATLGLEGITLDLNRAGVLAPADVHVAAVLGRLGGEADELVKLAAAFAVRAPRVGHVNVDLATVRETAASESEEDLDIAAFEWPDPAEWLARVETSPIVALGEEGGRARPLRLLGSALYLDRYWRDETAVAADLVARARASPPAVAADALEASLARLFGPGGDAEQEAAARTAVVRRLSVIAGGPGTGKTTTVARVLCALVEQVEALGGRLPVIGLAAPTGKAAARMEEAIRNAAVRIEASDAVRRYLLSLRASTIHRLLGRAPGSSTRFSYNRDNRLPHDAVIVDETSMVSLSLMARLLEAVRPDARLVLVGDPEQLASVEAGAVLGDIVGDESDSPGRDRTLAATGPLSRCIVVLGSNHRFEGALADLAAAIGSGDADRTLEILVAGGPAVTWTPVDVASATDADIEGVRRMAVDAGRTMVEAALAGEAEAALAALSAFRLVCAHRRGPAGVSTWNPTVAAWLGSEVPGYVPDGGWYVGRPVIVTANDYSLGLFNGDTGVVVARPSGSVAAAFMRAGAPFLVSPLRLTAVDTVFATTVHRAQGSEFAEVVLVLPEPRSRILTRELLYTAVTRAQKSVHIAGTEEAVRAGVGRPVGRASGLAARLARS